MRLHLQQPDIYAQRPICYPACAPTACTVGRLRAQRFSRSCSAMARLQRKPPVSLTIIGRLAAGGSNSGMRDRMGLQTSYTCPVLFRDQICGYMLDHDMLIMPTSCIQTAATATAIPNRHHGSAFAYALPVVA